MTMRRSVGFLWLFLCAAAAGGCNIRTCEHGADCRENADGDGQELRMCKLYCGRLSACGAPQAADFDGCLAACADRFEALPAETWELCACSESSRCADLSEGRCTRPDPERGPEQPSCPNASCSTGGRASGGNSGGAPSTGGSAQSTVSGGSTSTGNGGSDASAEMGGTSAAGAPAMACAASCDCPSGQRCLDGYCAD